MNASLPRAAAALLDEPEITEVTGIGLAPLSLAGLAPGQRAVITAVDGGCRVGRRLLDLGFRPGTPLRVMRRAPLGDPTTYELRGSRICLRRSEAARISVELTPGT